MRRIGGTVVGLLAVVLGVGGLVHGFYNHILERGDNFIGTAASRLYYKEVVLGTVVAVGGFAYLSAGRPYRKYDPEDRD